MITDSGKLVMCDYEDCDERVFVTRGEVGGHHHHPEHVLLAKAEREGWVCSEDGREFYCPKHTVSGIKIGNKVK